MDQTAVRPAEELPVTVYWQALAPMTDNYSVFVHLLGAGRTVVGQVNTYPGLGAWPTSTLPRGAVIADTYRVPVAPDAAAPSQLRVEVGLYNYDTAGRPALPAVAAGGQRVEPLLATAKLVPWDWPRVEPAHPLAIRLGDAISLIGYDLTDRLTLYWQATSRPSADYTVFVQVWDDHRQVAGFDGQPAGGDYPTHWCDAGETIIDRRPLDLSGLPAGRYRLLVGMYRLDTGERLPAVAAAGPLPDSAVELTPIDHGE